MLGSVSSEFLCGGGGGGPGGAGLWSGVGLPHRSPPGGSGGGGTGGG